MGNAKGESAVRATVHTIQPTVRCTFKVSKKRGMSPLPLQIYPQVHQTSNTNAVSNQPYLILCLSCSPLRVVGKAARDRLPEYNNPNSANCSSARRKLYDKKPAI